jgi:hypothetical protein
MNRESNKCLALGKGRQDRHLKLIRRQVIDVNLRAHGVLRIHHLLLDGLGVKESLINMQNLPTIAAQITGSVGVKQAEIAKQDIKCN